jgi:hypothetical protein
MKAATICPIILVLIIAGHIGVDLAWQKRNIAPDPWDQAGYLTLSERMYHQYQQEGISGFWDAFMGMESRRAPLVPAMYVGAYALAGNERLSAHIINYVALVVLCLSVYGIGRRLGGPWCGVCAAWLTMAMPMMFGLFRQLYVEFPLAAAAAAAAYLCVASDGLRRFGLWAPLGIVIGLGLLIKVTFPVFVIGPLAVALFTRSSEEKESSFAAKIVGLLVIAGLASVIAAPWLVRNAAGWTQFAQENVSGYLGEVYGSTGSAYLVSQAGMMLIGVHVLFLLGLLVAWLAFRKKVDTEAERLAFQVKADSEAARLKNRSMLILAGLWFIIPLIAGLIAKDKDTRLIAPAFPAAGVLLAYLYIRLTTAPVRFVTAGLMLLLALPVYWVSFKVPFNLQSPAGESRESSVEQDLGRTGILTAYGNAPVRQDWKGEEIVSAIEAQLPKKFIEDQQIAVVAVLTDHPFLQANWLSYLQWRRYVLRGEKRFSVDYAGMPALQAEASLNEMMEKLHRSHFVIVKDSGYQGGEYVTRWLGALLYAIRETEETYQGRKIRLFEKVDCDITLPDGSRLLVYQQFGKMHYITPSEQEEGKKLWAKFISLARSYIESEGRGGASTPAPQAGGG